VLRRLAWRRSPRLEEAPRAAAAAAAAAVVVAAAAAVAVKTSRYPRI